jgi:hypothetical protein
MTYLLTWRAYPHFMGMEVTFICRRDTWHISSSFPFGFQKKFNQDVLLKLIII